MQYSTFRTTPLSYKPASECFAFLPENVAMYCALRGTLLEIGSAFLCRHYSPDLNITAKAQKQVQEQWYYLNSARSSVHFVARSVYIVLLASNFL